VRLWICFLPTNKQVTKESFYFAKSNNLFNRISSRNISLTFISNKSFYETENSWVASFFLGLLRSGSKMVGVSSEKDYLKRLVKILSKSRCE